MKSEKSYLRIIWLILGIISISMILKWFDWKLLTVLFFWEFFNRLDILLAVSHKMKGKELLKEYREQEKQNGKETIQTDAKD